MALKFTDVVSLDDLQRELDNLTSAAASYYDSCQELEEKEKLAAVILGGIMNKYELSLSEIIYAYNHTIRDDYDNHFISYAKIIDDIKDKISNITTMVQLICVILYTEMGLSSNELNLTRNQYLSVYKNTFKNTFCFKLANNKTSTMIETFGSIFDFDSTNQTYSCTITSDMQQLLELYDTESTYYTVAYSVVSQAMSEFEDNSTSDTSSENN